jgi:hypothetical protein
MSQKQLLYYRLLPTATRKTSPAQGNSYPCHRNSSTTGYYQQLQERLQQLKETATHVIETAPLLPFIINSYKKSFTSSRKQLHIPQKQLLYYRSLPTITRKTSPAQENSYTCCRNSSTTGYYQQLQEQLHQLKETATHVTETAHLLPFITNSYKKSFTSSRKQLLY